MYFSFEELVLFSYFLEIRLKNEGHRIEKEGDIEYSISHRENFSSRTVRDEITESDRRRRDHREVESIEIWPVLCWLKWVNEKCSEKPAREEYDGNDDELSVVDMEHSRYSYE